MTNMAEQQPLFPSPDQTSDIPVDKADFARRISEARESAGPVEYVYRPSEAAITEGHVPVDPPKIGSENSEDKAIPADPNSDELTEDDGQPIPTSQLTVDQQNANEARWVATHHRSLYE